MTKVTVKSYGFNKAGINTLGEDPQESNWPVVYQIFDDESLYVGETTNLKSRMLQHIQNPEKTSLNKLSVVFDDSYNKSVALDLEAQLIQWFGGDGKYKMLNKNDGLVDRDYYDRESYRKQFSKVWGELRKMQIADKTTQDIENSGLFKFSPYKRLKQSQIDVVNEVLTDLDEAFMNNSKSISVVGGDEGTGKSIVLMYLAKLIRDIQDSKINADDAELSDQDFDLFFNSPFKERFMGKSIAMVIPNSSLKGSIAKIIKTISNMGTIDLLSPIDFGANEKTYDITFVDEAHLLKMSNQEVHKANREKVDRINRTLFDDDNSHTELDWIIKKSRNVIMVYGDQRVRPNNVTRLDLQNYSFREHILKSQIRSNGGESYINYLRALLSNTPPIEKVVFEDFEFKLFEDFAKFVDAIKTREKEVGLSRLVAGFAWDWKSNKKGYKDSKDIVIDDIGFQWNSTLSDWVGSKNSVNEVGSIYTIQGYDLNYCGVIIGKDLKYDPIEQRLVFNRENYYDRGAKKRNKIQLESNTKLTDSELLDQVVRTYRILMNRSIKGTYVYVCDKNLRNYLKRFIDAV